MHGPKILERSLQTPSVQDASGKLWQYHSRSDRHSKIASWSVAFDMLVQSALLRSHASTKKVIIGVNHTMVDYATGRKKDLDLVVARPLGNDYIKTAGSFKSLVDDYEISLDLDERSILRNLPDITVAPVSSVLVAMESKACMTAHVKSLPRLYDELNSSHLCIHGASTQALAIGYVQVNGSDSFISPNPRNAERAKLGAPLEITPHRQPSATMRVMDKVNEIPRRSNNNSQGFDAIGVTVLDIKNDGSPITVLTDPPAPQPGNPFDYGSMISRMAHEYDTRFSHI